jgi:hypothetical protein
MPIKTLAIHIWWICAPGPLLAAASTRPLGQVKPRLRSVGTVFRLAVRDVDEIAQAAGKIARNY